MFEVAEWEPEPEAPRGRKRAGQEAPRAGDARWAAPRGEAAGGPGRRSRQRGAGAQAAAKGPEEEPGPRLSRRQWRNRQKNQRRQKRRIKAGVPPVAPAAAQQPPVAPAAAPEPPVAPAAAQQPLHSPEDPAAPEPLSGRAASLRLRLEERLESARFRFLNQQLYTSSSQQAVQLFQDDPEALAVYHRGFARQVAQWPENPVQRLVRYLRQRPASLVVADFGCGDCALARGVRNKVHCFDLVALDPRVTVCDMAKVPLDDETVDVGVFCLALMGTNLQEILEEANRVLRVGGTLLVAEVASRFPDVRAFVGALARLGFRLVSQDVSGSHFFTFELRKTHAPRRKGRGQEAPPPPGLALRPCLYKRR